MSQTRKFRKRLREDTKEGRNLRIYLGSAIVIAGLFFAVLANSAFAGGWEMSTSLSSVTIEGEQFTTTGLHNFDEDVDGTFEAAVDAAGSYQDIYQDSFDHPEIQVKTSYSYYVKEISGNWVAVTGEDIEPYDEYTVPQDISNVGEYQSYYHWKVAVDVTIQTNGKVHYKPLGSYWDYGYYFEDALTDTDILLGFAVTPWDPVGIQGDWQIQDGWSGVMSATIGNIDLGLLSSNLALEGEDADNPAIKDYSIQGLHSVDQALNIHGETNKDFDSTGALEGVPDDVDIEVGGQLQAGARYFTDALGHWTACAVDNVYVTYQVIIDVMSTLVWKFITGGLPPIKPPIEDNPIHPPRNTAIDAFFDAINSFISGPFFMIFMVVVLVIGGYVLYGIFKKE